MNLRNQHIIQRYRILPIQTAAVTVNPREGMFQNNLNSFIKLSVKINVNNKNIGES